MPPDDKLLLAAAISHYPRSFLLTTFPDFLSGSMDWCQKRIDKDPEVADFSVRSRDVTADGLHGYLAARKAATRYRLVL